MTFNYYVELFRPNTAFSFHFKPDDIALMQEMEETRKYFSAEYAVKNAKLVLDYVEGVREDVDYAYIANFAKLINLAIENRNAFCQEADFRQEIRRLILSSNHILVPIGFVLGIPLGLALANMIALSNAASGGILMSTTLTGKTLLISAVFIAAAYVVSLALSARKLKKVDMVECLKEERE